MAGIDIATLLMGASTQPDSCLVVAEVAQAHDGSVGLAHSYIDAVADSGADAIKFQTHIAAAESTLQEPWRVPFSPQDASRYDYWKRMEFTEDQWRGLKTHAEERGLIFLSSPFSLEAIELLESIGITAWKVPSGEAFDTPLLERLIETKLPILLSTGMSSLPEIDAVVDRVRSAGVPLAVLQCTSAYPCPPDKVGVNLIPFFQQRYECPVGLSDHSGTIYPALAAVTLRARVIEVHVTLSRQMFGPDVESSVTVSELQQLVEGVRVIEEMMRTRVDKDEMAVEAAPLRAVFGKSVMARTDLQAGTVLRSDDLAFKKPGTGIPASSVDEVVGRRLRRDVRADEMLQSDDLEATR